ncbi:MAG: bifunctional adenosylcobinamide kinase/adenosylcobinamide-phosphate guanylyltransferase [Propionibacteriaceae bacterium]|jgi:adenosylcobinamide kinase/adenosylcobinamide-phosphate guanylyltransferase|nr:bifunctional adenosylcobinamide kinase/adenosylcobinamide-phosphate guanylyltransferase [Propionibacteriaceae bacterium]
MAGADQPLSAPLDAAQSDPDRRGLVLLVTGGVRSGKSAYAEAVAARRGRRGVVYLATAYAGDDEMADRIRRHQASRPADWTTWERTSQLAGIAQDGPAGDWDCLIVDCLANLVSNVMFSQLDQPDEGAAADFDQIEASLIQDLTGLVEFTRGRGASLVLVSNEVGLGLVPPGRSSRYYRDILGRVNQVLAELADAVVLMVCGQALTIKGRPDR